MDRHGLVGLPMALIFLGAISALPDLNDDDKMVIELLIVWMVEHLAKNDEGWTWCLRNTGEDLKHLESTSLAAVWKQYDERLVILAWHAPF